MCGIVGAIAQRNVVPILVEGLRRLEYRGYDSAGVATIADHRLQIVRAVGKVAELEAAGPKPGTSGIAHTRWATHGVPAERNSHPHYSKDIAVVHNGIIENHEELRAELQAKGFTFTSETDTEVIAHLVQSHVDAGDDLRAAMLKAVNRIHGAYALAVISAKEPTRMLLARRGSPLAIGIGVGEMFAASDATALVSVTSRIVYLDEGDLGEITLEGYAIFDKTGAPRIRREQLSALSTQAVEKGEYRHFMQKEIFEQPQALAATLEGRIADGRVLESFLGPKAAELLTRVQRVRIVACGTSANAGTVARYWMEQIARIPCRAELASEFRYRDPIIEPDTLFITISQSGDREAGDPALRGHHQALGRSDAASLRPPLHAHRPATALAGA